jgi:hypothetical protein
VEPAREFGTASHEDQAVQQAPNGSGPRPVSAAVLAARAARDSARAGAAASAAAAAPDAPEGTVTPSDRLVEQVVAVTGDVGALTSSEPAREGLEDPWRQTPSPTEAPAAPGTQDGHDLQ